MCKYKCSYAHRRPCSQAYLPILCVMHSSSENITWTSTLKAITVKPFTEVTGPRVNPSSDQRDFPFVVYLPYSEAHSPADKSVCSRVLREMVFNLAAGYGGGPMHLHWIHDSHGTGSSTIHPRLLEKGSNFSLLTSGR